MDNADDIDIVIKGITFFRSYYESLAGLEAESRLRLYDAIFAYAFIIFLSATVSSASKMTLFQNILMYAWFPAYIALRITLERLGYVVGEIEDK